MEDRASVNGEQSDLQDYGELMRRKWCFLRDLCIFSFSLPQDAQVSGSGRCRHIVSLCTIGATQWQAKRIRVHLPTNAAKNIRLKRVQVNYLDNHFR